MIRPGEGQRSVSRVMQDKDDTTGFAILANERGNSVIGARGVSWLLAEHLGRGRPDARGLIVLVFAASVALAVNLASNLEPPPQPHGKRAADVAMG
jgi:hypothetical protein